MEIIGNSEFKLNTKKALKIIREKEPFWYDYIVMFIGRLVQNNRTFLYPYENVSYYIDNKLSSSDSVIYASSILREAYHAFLVREHLLKNESADFDYYNGKLSMKKSYEIQMMLLKKLGGSEEMIQQVNLELCNKLNDTEHEIKIIGSKMFVEKVNSAIELLKIKDYNSYKVVIQNIRRIVQFDDSFFTYFDRFQDVPTIFISNSDLNAPVYDLSSGLLHEACHSKLYKDAKENKKNPEVECHGYSAEMYCLTRQIECLKKLGAPKDVIQHYISYYDYKWWDSSNEIKFTKKR